MNQLQARCRQAMRKLFQTMDADVHTLVLTNTTTEYDPATQDVVENANTLEIKGLVSGYSDAEVNGVLIHKDDIKVQFIDTDLGSFTLDSNTTFTYGGQQFNIIRVRPQMMKTVFHVQARTT